MRTVPQSFLEWLLLRMVGEPQGRWWKCPFADGVLHHGYHVAINDPLLRSDGTPYPVKGRCMRGCAPGPRGCFDELDLIGLLYPDLQYFEPRRVKRDELQRAWEAACRAGGVVEVGVGGLDPVVGIHPHGEPEERCVLDRGYRQRVTRWRSMIRFTLDVLRRRYRLRPSAALEAMRRYIFDGGADLGREPLLSDLYKTVCICWRAFPDMALQASEAYWSVNPSIDKLYMAVFVEWVNEHEGGPTGKRLVLDEVRGQILVRNALVGRPGPSSLPPLKPHHWRRVT